MLACNSLLTARIYRDLDFMPQIHFRRLALTRRHPNIAAVALANKNVRTVWAILAHGREFKPDYVPTRMVA